MIEDRWSNAIDSITADFVKTFGHLNAEQLNWKPKADSWSIAENLNHLIIINETYYPILNALRNGTYQTPWLGKVNLVPDFFGRILLKAVSPDRTKKYKTFRGWDPAKSALPPDIVSAFERHQQGLKDSIKECGYLLHRVINSPLSRAVVYRLDIAFDIVVSHEKRHFEQAREVLELLKSKA